MRIWAGFAVLGLASCTTTAPSEPVAGVRDISAPIAATTRFEPARMAGNWTVRQTVMSPNVGSINFAWDGAGYVVTDGAGRETRQYLTDGARWTDPNGTETWLLWVDADYRTAALGNPAGTVGMIIDRSAKGGTDRITAARDIMVWFGYSEATLR